MSCHHSGPSTQGTGQLLRVSPREDECFALTKHHHRRHTYPTASQFTRQKEGQSTQSVHQRHGAVVLGIPFLCFQQHSLRAAGKLLSVQVPQAKEAQSRPMSLLATCALLLHTLSPLCDQSTVRKGLLVCRTTQVHRTGDLPKLPARINMFLVLTWPSWCRGCSETG